jgi:hypothetical protein
MDPNGDTIIHGWTPSTGTTHYTMVNKAIRQPAAPSTATWLSDDDAMGDADNFDLTDPGVGAAHITICSYGKVTDPGDGAYISGVPWNTGSSLSAQALNNSSTVSWASATWDGTWTAGQMAAAQVLVGTSTYAGGLDYIYALYVETSL